MFKDYLEKNSLHPCCYDTYRSVFQDMNISFTKLVHEECEMCEKFELHDNNHSKENLDQNCNACQVWKIHNQKVKEARTKYNSDSDRYCIFFCRSSKSNCYPGWRNVNKLPLRDV